MNYKCFICKKTKLFRTNNEAVVHLKKFHKILDKKSTIWCTVKNSKCEKHFLTYSGLYKHVKNCVKNIENSPKFYQSDDSTKEIVDHSVHTDSSIENDSSQANKFKDTFLYESDSSISGGSSISPPLNSTFISDSELSTPNLGFGNGFEFNSSNDWNVNEHQANRSIRKFAMELCQLKVNQATLNQIFKIALRLIQYTHEICYKSVETRKGAPLEALDATMEAISVELNKFSSTYKREELIKSDENYVAPKEHGIGTHIDVKRDKKTKLIMPIQNQ